MTPLATTDSDHELVQSRLTQAYRDMAAADIERLLELYLPDALLQIPGQAPIVGTTAIRAFWLARFERFHVETEAQVQEVTVFGDVFVVRGRQLGVFTPRNGEATVHVDSWFLQIHHRQADGTLHLWRSATGPNP